MMLLSTIAIVGGFLIDGYGGPPLVDSVVLLAGDRIVAVGPKGEIEIPAGSTIVDAEGLTVMPGLIDTHVHLDILGHGDYPTWHGMARADYAEVMALSAAQLLRHGVTTARDAGGEIEASVRTKMRIEAGEIPGPRLVLSGGWIQNWPDEQARAHHRRFNYNVHTPEEARAVTASLIEKGADAIKAYTGLTLEQMRAVTDEAHKRG
jgi:imidazolonepropionase-like amidohydrolase